MPIYTPWTLTSWVKNDKKKRFWIWSPKNISPSPILAFQNFLGEIFEINYWEGTTGARLIYISNCRVTFRVFLEDLTFSEFFIFIWYLRRFVQKDRLQIIKRKISFFSKLFYILALIVSEESETNADLHQNQWVSSWENSERFFGSELFVLSRTRTYRRMSMSTSTLH